MGEHSGLLISTTCSLSALVVVLALGVCAMLFQVGQHLA